MKPLYWLTTAALEHVDIVKEKGYTQVNMGPKEPLEKMHKGDRILYYSPTMYFEQPEPCQQFTAISCISDDEIYPQDPVNPVRWRRNAEYMTCNPEHAGNFHHDVEFLHKHENWVDAFKQNVFEISQNDFITIAKRILLPFEDRCFLF